METRILGQRLVAALVLFSFMVMFIAFWGMAKAGERKLRSLTECQGATAESGFTPKLGLAATAGEMLAILDPSATLGENAAACRREVFKAQVEADSAFVVGCSLLLVAFFVFVGSLRGTLWWSLPMLVAGLAVSAAYAYGDASENRQLLLAIEAAAAKSVSAMPAPEALGFFFAVKTGALALAALVLGSLWTSRTGSGWIYLLKIFCWLAGLAFGAALFLGSEAAATAGMGLTACWWISGLAHAILIAASES